MACLTMRSLVLEFCSVASLRVESILIRLGSGLPSGSVESARLTRTSRPGRGSGTTATRSSWRRSPNEAYSRDMSTHRADDKQERDRIELPIEELLRRARPLPPHEEMVIDDLSEEEGAAFLRS